MTALLTKTIRQAAFAAALVASITSLSTPSFAWSSEAKQACMGDVFRVCGSEVPNVERVTACMMRSRSVVSPGCRTAMNRELSGQRTASKVAAQ